MWQPYNEIAAYYYRQGEWYLCLANATKALDLAVLKEEIWQAWTHDYAAILKEIMN